MQIKNTENVRKVIADEIELVRKGDSNPARANAIANLIGKLLNSVKLDIEVHKYFAKASALKMSTNLVEEIIENKKKK